MSFLNGIARGIHAFGARIRRRRIEKGKKILFPNLGYNPTLNEQDIDTRANRLKDLEYLFNPPKPLPNPTLKPVNQQADIVSTVQNTVENIGSRLGLGAYSKYFPFFLIALVAYYFP